MKNLFFWVLALVPVCFGANRFVLDAELRTNFADNGSSTQFLTGYTYDANGNRVQSRVWSGADSTEAPMSAVSFTYDGTGAVTQALQRSGTDTSAIVRYAYSGGKLVAVRTLAKDGTLRFTDSLLYDGQGRNIEEQRIVAGVKTFYHRFTLNSSGKTTADSLYEPVSSVFVADQALLFTYNPDSTVATEVQWRLSGGSWYCISTAFMNYTGGSLVSVATHDRDGAGTGMTDSLAYTYDTSGNRSREEDYDGTKALLHRIVYTWRATQPAVVLMGEKARIDQRPVLSYRQGRLTADLRPQDRGMIILFDIAGKLMTRIPVDHSGIVPLTGIMGKGPVIALFSVNGVTMQTMNFTNYN